MITRRQSAMQKATESRAQEILLDDREEDENVGRTGGDGYDHDGASIEEETIVMVGGDNVDAVGGDNVDAAGGDNAGMGGAGREDTGSDNVDARGDDYEEEGQAQEETAVDVDESIIGAAELGLMHAQVTALDEEDQGGEDRIVEAQANETGQPTIMPMGGGAPKEAAGTRMEPVQGGGGALTLAAKTKDNQHDKVRDGEEIVQQLEMLDIMKGILGDTNPGYQHFMERHSQWANNEGWTEAHLQSGHSMAQEMKEFLDSSDIRGAYGNTGTGGDRREVISVASDESIAIAMAAEESKQDDDQQQVNTQRTSEALSQLVFTEYLYPLMAWLSRSRGVGGHERIVMENRIAHWIERGSLPQEELAEAVDISERLQIILEESARKMSERARDGNSWVTVGSPKTKGAKHSLYHSPPHDKTKVSGATMGGGQFHVFRRDDDVDMDWEQDNLEDPSRMKKGPKDVLAQLGNSHMKKTRTPSVRDNEPTIDFHSEPGPMLQGGGSIDWSSGIALQQRSSPGLKGSGDYVALSAGQAKGETPSSGADQPANQRNVKLMSWGPGQSLKMKFSAVPDPSPSKMPARLQPATHGVQGLMRSGGSRHGTASSPKDKPNGRNTPRSGAMDRGIITYNGRLYAPVDIKARTHDSQPRSPPRHWQAASEISPHGTQGGSRAMQQPMATPPLPAWPVQRMPLRAPTVADISAEQYPGDHDNPPGEHDNCHWPKSPVHSNDVAGAVVGQSRPLNGIKEGRYANIPIGVAESYHIRPLRSLYCFGRGSRHEYDFRHHIGLPMGTPNHAPTIEEDWRAAMSSGAVLVQRITVRHPNGQEQHGIPVLTWRATPGNTKDDISINTFGLGTDLEQSHAFYCNGIIYLRNGRLPGAPDGHRWIMTPFREQRRSFIAIRRHALLIPDNLSLHEATCARRTTTMELLQYDRWINDGCPAIDPYRHGYPQHDDPYTPTARSSRITNSHHTHDHHSNHDAQDPVSLITSMLSPHLPSRREAPADGTSSLPSPSNGTAAASPSNATTHQANDSNGSTGQAADAGSSAAQGNGQGGPNDSIPENNSNASSAQQAQKKKKKKKRQSRKNRSGGAGGDSDGSDSSSESSSDDSTSSSSDASADNEPTQVAAMHAAKEMKMKAYSSIKRTLETLTPAFTPDTVYLALKGLERLAVSEGVVDPTTIEPPTYHRKLLLHSAITSILVKSGYQHVAADLPDPRISEAWSFKRLRNIIMRNLSPASHHLVNTSMKVHNFRMRPKESVNEAYYRWTALVEQMTKGKCTPKMMDDHVLSFVNALPSELKAYVLEQCRGSFTAKKVRNLAMWKESSLAVAGSSYNRGLSLPGRMASIEDQDEDDDYETEQDIHVMMASTPHTTYPPAQPRAARTCFVCQDPTHYASACPLVEQARQLQQQGAVNSNVPTPAPTATTTAPATAPYRQALTRPANQTGQAGLQDARRVHFANQPNGRPNGQGPFPRRQG